MWIRLRLPTLWKAVIADLQRTFPTDVQMARTFRPPSRTLSTRPLVMSAVRCLKAVIIVSVIMLLFLMNWRTAIITLSAIPLSLLIGLMLMKAFGLGINTMTLGGLVVAIGSVVDDSIVDMENCYRGLRTNQAQGNPQNIPFRWCTTPLWKCGWR